jgi:sulfur carrier protein
MEIIINNEIKNTVGHTTLHTLMNEILGDRQKGVAVAVNDTVIAREQWSSVVLQPKDNILIIKATQGG